MFVVFVSVAIAIAFRVTARTWIKFAAASSAMMIRDASSHQHEMPADHP
jgi:hypothetical protein